GSPCTAPVLTSSGSPNTRDQEFADPRPYLHHERLGGLSKDFCDPQEQTEVLLELTGRRDIAAQRQQDLPGGHDELRIAEPDLMLFRLGSVQDAIELHGASERPRVPDRER